MRVREFYWIGIGLSFLPLFGAGAFAEDKEWINQELLQFQNNPREFIHSHDSVTKFDPDTLEPIPVQSKFSKESIESGEYIRQKDQTRGTGIPSYSWSVRSAFLSNDNPANLVDELKLTKLQEMERAKLMASQLPSSPWSDDYWPIYMGGMAKRYADPNFPKSKDWRTNIKYITTQSCSVDQLSPTEKYDLLVGDSNHTLTKTMIADGQRSALGDGSVPTWVGYCHGWAPASYMAPRPTHGIRLLASDARTRITFYPSDIKALTSLLWAKASLPPRFIGGRCNEKSPAEDANGRILSQNCFDTNPGTWHLSVVNQIGASQRGFVIDATYDYEVWNQPVYAYDYSYFNPNSRKAVSNLKDALVEMRGFKNDLFSKYRSKTSAYVVGIVMKLTYVAETKPTVDLSDAPSKDRRVGVKYIYDLELDKYGNIIGGEWYQRQHPDFLWTFRKGARAVSAGDEYLNGGTWNGQGPIPPLWAKAVQSASQRGQPLATIVEALHTFSLTAEMTTD